MEVLKLVLGLAQIALGMTTVVIGIKVLKKERGEDDEKK